MQSQRLQWGFPILALAAFYLMWGIMWRFDGFAPPNTARATRRLEDGTPLKTVYTGLAPLDAILTTKVVLNYEITSGRDLAAWLLMLEVTITVQTATLWRLVDSSRVGRSTRLLAFPALWALFWNASGAAVVLPLYMLFSLRNPPRNDSLPLSEAKSLSASIFLGSFIPTFARLCARFIPRSPAQHQNILALYEASPIAVSAFQYLFSRTIFRSTAPSSAAAARPNQLAYLPPLRRAYLFAGVVATLSHLYVLSHALSTPGLLTYAFVPPSPTATATLGDGVRGGAVLFLQWDYIILALSAWLWSYCLIAPYVAEGGGRFSAVRLGGGLAVAGIVLGPAPLVTGCLWWKEGRTVRAGKGKRGE